MIQKNIGEDKNVPSGRNLPSPKKRIHTTNIIVHDNVSCCQTILAAIKLKVSCSVSTWTRSQSVESKIVYQLYDRLHELRRV